LLITALYGNPRRMSIGFFGELLRKVARFFLNTLGVVKIWCSEGVCAGGFVKIV
jgi:hypothetical protein